MERVNALLSRTATMGFKTLVEHQVAEERPKTRKTHFHILKVILTGSMNRDGQLTYRIATTWDSKQVMHAPVTITFKPGEEGLVMEVSAPFFNDPPSPPGEPGKPFNGLWDYEVVESFFLNSKTIQYLEVELCPHGQHLVLLLSGVGEAFKKELDLKFVADTGSHWGTWSGSALIPWSYFPPGVDMMNSYAIHGSGIGRVYESLYPIPPEEIQDGQGPNLFEDVKGYVTVMLTLKGSKQSPPGEPQDSVFDICGKIIEEII